MSCNKTYTDLEVNELIDNFMTGEMKCQFCGGPVEENEAAGPQSDSRQALARFNKQMEILFTILQSVENIKLDPSVLEPEPVELGDEKGAKSSSNAPKVPTDGGKWSGEATRGQGFGTMDQDIKIDFGDESSKAKDVPKDVPIWITQSTVEGTEGLNNFGGPDSSSYGAGTSGLIDTSSTKSDTNAHKNTDDDDEITRLLLQHEKKNSATSSAAKTLVNDNNSESDKSDDSDMEDVNPFGVSVPKSDKVDTMSSDDDAEDGIPTVKVGHEEITITDVNEDIINRMTAEEKERYTQIFQEFYAHMYD